MSASPTLAVPSTACLALSLAVGCAQAPAPSLDDEPRLRAKTQRVFGGTPSTAETDAVVQIETAVSLCTGTMVAPRLMVTARHCVSPHVEGTFHCSVEGGYSSSVPRSPADAGEIGPAYPPEEIQVTYGQFPFDKEPAIGEKIYTVATDTICRNDIALVRIDRELPVPIRPMRLKDPTFPGELVTVVGYGFTDTDVAGRHERHDMEIFAVGKSTLYPQGKNAFDRTLGLGQGACRGDSGGPTLAGSGAVLGVASLLVNNDDCTSAGAQTYYTQLAPYRDFIEAAFGDSGFDVLYEPSSTGAGGSAGASGDSAGSGGSDSTGGSAGEATTGPRVIPGRRKKNDGCSFGVAGDEHSGWQWGSLVLGLVALRRRSQLKRAPR